MYWFHSMQCKRNAPAAQATIVLCQQIESILFNSNTGYHWRISDWVGSMEIPRKDDIDDSFLYATKKTKSSFHIDLIYKACHIMRPQTWKRISITNVPSYHLSQVTYSINKTEVRRFFFRLPFSPCGKKSQNPELNFLVDSFVNIFFEFSSILPSVVCCVFEQRA